MLKCQDSFFRVVIFGTVAFFAQVTGAVETVPDHCPTGPTFDAIPYLPILDDTVLLESDSGISTHSNSFRLEGNVAVQKDKYILFSDRADYQRREQQLAAEGHVRFQSDALLLIGDSAQIDFSQEAGRLTETRYYLPASGARGQAGLFQYSENDLLLHNATYTKCNEDHSDWRLSASTIKLNQQQNEGSATNVVIQVRDVPVLYIPYISFPLTGRKSGFLAPNFRYSEQNGMDITLPYYLNLAPHRDATLFPRYNEKRGAQIGTEFRYLNKQNYGDINLEYMPKDTQREISRGFYQLTHRQTFPQNTRFDLSVSHVTDIDYFRELGSNLTSAGQSQLVREATVSGAGQHWTASALIQDYQTLDANILAPYRRLPSLTAAYIDRARFFSYRLDSDYTYFNHPVLLDGQRLRIQPVIETRFERDAGFIRTSLTATHTQYAFRETANNLYRTVPSGVIDSGVFFERGGDKFLQSLEPRLTFVYTPFVNQDALPNFDTGVLDTTYSQLFRAQRYSGGDRVGDIQRLTATVTNRFISQQSGKEIARVGFAHAVYTRDQQVALVNETKYHQGDYLDTAQLNSQISDNLRLRGSLFTDSQLTGPVKGGIHMDYEKNLNAASLSYRYRQDQLEYFNLGGLWNLNDQWSFVGSWSYSIRTSSSPEAIFGFEYNNCCWKMRMVSRHYITDTQGNSSNSIGIQLELKGLTSFGRALDNRFSNEILGYIDEN